MNEKKDNTWTFLLSLLGFAINMLGIASWIHVNDYGFIFIMNLVFAFAFLMMCIEACEE